MDIKKFKITIILCLFLAIGTQGQSISDSAIIVLQQEVNALKSANKYLNSELVSQKKWLQTFFDSMSVELETNQATIQALSDSLHVKIIATEQNTTTQIADVNQSVNKKSLFTIIGGIVLLLLSVALFVWLYRKQKNSRADIIGQLEKQKTIVEEQLVKEFAKQTEVMESLLKTLRELPVTSISGELDHSLALKLADEITLMERNISFMDSNTKGLKQLNRSIGKLKDNLAANGYEIPELLGKPYNEGMKVIVINSTYDERLQEDEKIISKIIKPQVNYKDKMIQAAQIELNVG